MKRFILNQSHLEKTVGNILLYWLLDVSGIKANYLCHPCKVISFKYLNPNEDGTKDAMIEIQSMKTQESFQLIIPENGILIQQDEKELKFIKFISPLGAEFNPDPRFMDSEEQEVSQEHSYGEECLKLKDLSLSPLNQLTMHPYKLMDGDEPILVGNILITRFHRDGELIDANGFEVTEIRVPRMMFKMVPDGFIAPGFFLNNYGVGITENGLVLLLDPEVDYTKIKSVLQEYNQSVLDERCEK